MRELKRKRVVGAASVLVGVAVLVAALTYGVRPATWISFALFAGTFAALELRSVEVNDKLYMSSSVMAIITGGVVFALGADGAAFQGMALMAVLGPFVPADFRERRVFQPAVNFGQLLVSAATAGWVIDALIGTPERRDLLGGSLLKVALVGAVAAVVYSSLNIGLVRLIVRAVYGVRNLMPWSGMGTLFMAQMAMGLLGGLLGGLLVQSGATADGDVAAAAPILPLVLGVYVLGHLVFSSYAKLRIAHEDTMRGFVKTLEARDLYTRGHTERVAYFTRVIAEQFGFTGTQMERMRWAALIHDMGKLAVPVDLMDRQGGITDTEYRSLRTSMHRVDDLLSEVDFLRPMVDIASGCHPRLMGEDFGQVGHSHTTDPTLEQQILAVADAFDAMTSTRSYRMARSQRLAFESLAEADSVLLDREVLAALRRGLDARGESYGPPDIDERLESLEGAFDAAP